MQLSTAERLNSSNKTWQFFYELILRLSNIQLQSLSCKYPKYFGNPGNIDYF